MTLLPLLALAVLVAWGFGARLGGLARLPFRATLLLYVALAIQVVAFGPVPALDGDAVMAAQIASYALTIVFCVANRRVPGVAVIAVGVASNALVITLNGGLMPVDPAAVAASGWSVATYGDAYPNIALASDGTHLSWLGDVFGIPRFPGSAPLSIGDFAMIVGAWLLLVRGTGTSAGGPSRRRDSPIVDHALLAAVCAVLVAASALAPTWLTVSVGAATGAAIGSRLARVLAADLLPSRALPTAFAVVMIAALVTVTTPSAPTIALVVAVAAALAVAAAISTARRGVPAAVDVDR